MSRFARRIHRDQRGFIGKMMGFWLVFLLIFGVAVADAASIAFARYKVADAAGNAATEAAYQYKQTHDVSKACAAAAGVVASADPSAHIPDKSGCSIDKQNGSVTVTVRKVATTLVVSRVSFLQKYGDASATGSAPAPF
jgi:Flp pilus assembly protein TadG